MTICILYGGRSGEHEVSLRSAASVAKSLDPSKYHVIAIGIDKAGRWHRQEEIRLRSTKDQGEVLLLTPSTRPVSVVPSDGIHDGSERLPIDCVFPVLHGTFGEDGTVQGLLEIAGLPYVGAGVLGSAASMDKETSKRLWRDHRLPIVEFHVVDRASGPAERRAAAEGLGWPVFVKPCAAGSSLGAARAADDAALDAALDEALRYDTRALVERCIEGRELECAVIGNARPRAFPPGEVVPSETHGFYDYDAKYTDPRGARLLTAAALDDGVRQAVMRMAEAAYGAVRCEGMARVDFFLEHATGKVFVNEINTIPGFTSISMFPRMCEASGLSYPRLLDSLVELALAREKERKTIRFEK
jgi:D-alanine-D-alanine ligase